MPRFYFQVTNGKTIPDEIGDRFDSVDEAIRHAITMARELGHARPPTNTRENVSVIDEHGNEVFRTPI
jgi:hypothetical protein